jgi:hypothetical protein
MAPPVVEPTAAPTPPPPAPPRPEPDAFETPLMPSRPRTRPKGRRWLAILIVAALIALAAGVGIALSGGGDGSNDTAKFPSNWDPRVERLARFVEGRKQTTFPNPVYVDFLSDSEYTERARAIVREPGYVNPVLELPTPVLRALGLVQGDADLVAATRAVQSNRNVLYSTSSQRIAVRGKNLDKNTEVSLVGALTLALDQQVYGLEKSFDSDEAEFAYNAMRDGDAARIVTSYLAALDPAERAGIEDPTAVDFAGVNDVVRSFARAPGIVGEQFVDALLQDGGNPALTRAFSKPPFSAEHLVNATSFINGDDPKPVDPPKLESGESKGRESGTLGALAWLIVLGEHGQPTDALAAVNGWGGDAYVTYEAQNRACIKTNWVGDSRAAVDAMEKALNNFVSAMPPGNAQFSNANGILTLAACDPGAGASITTGTSKDAMALVNFRAEAFKLQLSQDVPVDQAWCVADKVATTAKLSDAQQPAVLQQPEWASKMAQYALDCSSPSG